MYERRANKQYKHGAQIMNDKTTNAANTGEKKTRRNKHGAEKGGGKCGV